MILHFLLRKNKKSKVATTLMKMIVNRGAKIITQTLELVESSSDEVPWNGVSVTLFKEKEIWFILDLKANTYTVKTQFWKSHHCKENLYFLNIIFGIFLFSYMKWTNPLLKRGAPSQSIVRWTIADICAYLYILKRIERFGVY